MPSDRVEAECIVASDDGAVAPDDGVTERFVYVARDSGVSLRC